MKKNKFLISSGIFSLFFVLQGVGYIHGHEKYNQINPENAMAFGIYHLAHIFKPFENLAWPLTPLLCGLVLLFMPFIEIDKASNSKQNENLTNLFIAIFIPISIAILQVSFFGPEVTAENAHKMSEKLPHHAIFSFVYISLYLIVTILCWYYIYSVKKWFQFLPKFFPKAFLILLATIWLLYGCYMGSRLDGALDKIRSPDDSIIEMFF